MKLLLPVDHLTSAEEKLAHQLFGLPETGQPNPDFPEVAAPPAFFVELGSDTTEAAKSVMDMLVKIYGLHPFFELDIHSHTVWSDDEYTTSLELEYAIN